MPDLVLAVAIGLHQREGRRGHILGPSQPGPDQGPRKMGLSRSDRPVEQDAYRPDARAGQADFAQPRRVILAWQDQAKDDRAQRTWPESSPCPAPPQAGSGAQLPAIARALELAGRRTSAVLAARHAEGDHRGAARQRREAAGQQPPVVQPRLARPTPRARPSPPRNPRPRPRAVEGADRLAPIGGERANPAVRSDRSRPGRAARGANRRGSTSPAFPQAKTPRPPRPSRRSPTGPVPGRPGTGGCGSSRSRYPRTAWPAPRRDAGRAMTR